MSMNTAPAPHRHVHRLAAYGSLLTLVFIVAAWAMTAIGQFSGSVTVAVLALSAFWASWLVTGRRRDNQELWFVPIRARVR